LVLAQFNAVTIAEITPATMRKFKSDIVSVDNSYIKLIETEIDEAIMPLSSLYGKNIGLKKYLKITSETIKTQIEYQMRVDASGIVSDLQKFFIASVRLMRSGMPDLIAVNNARSNVKFSYVDTLGRKKNSSTHIMLITRLWVISTIFSAFIDYALLKKYTKIILSNGEELSPIGDFSKYTHPNTKVMPVSTEK
jgi:hypothetical protein